MAERRKGEFKIDIDVEYPSRYTPRFVLAVVLARLAVRVFLGRCSIDEVSRTRPVLDTKMDPVLDPEDKATYRGTPVHAGKSFILDGNADLELRKCRHCGKPSEHLHRTSTAVDLCWPCFDEYLTETQPDCHRCGLPLGDEYAADRRDRPHHFRCLYPEREHREPGPAPVDKLDPANCHECGLPHGGDFARGGVTNRPYHFDCLYPKPKGV